MAQNPLGSIAERQIRQLSLRGETIEARLTEARAAYAINPCDSISMLIYELEKQSTAVRSAIERLSGSSQPASTAPQEEPQSAVVEDFVEDTVASEEVEPQDETISPIPPAEEQPQAVEEKETAENVEIVEEVVKEEVEEEVDVVVVPTLPEPTPIETPDTKIVVSDNLKSLFNTSRRRYAMTQSEIETLVKEYEAIYDSINNHLKGYEDATSLKKLEKHYANYLAAVARATKLANEVADRSDLLFTSKTNTYLGFADSLGMDTLRTLHAARAEQSELVMSQKLAGKCSDLDLALYPHRLHSTMVLEAELSAYLEPEVADSLQLLVENHDVTYALFTPIGTPKRSNVKFAAVSIKKKVKEQAVSALPTLKIPSEGELYSITVGNYASLPPSTKVFRGATPLYRERREDGRTYIYLGLYPTARSAQDDIALLRKAGFKQPTLVMWRDGIRRDDFVDRNSTPANKSTMYRVEIAGSSGPLSAPIQALIREKAPRKEISKFTSSDGATIYTVGIFTKESEAKALSSAIQKADSNLKATVGVIGGKK